VCSYVKKMYNIDLVSTKTGAMYQEIKWVHYIRNSTYCLHFILGKLSIYDSNAMHVLPQHTIFMANFYTVNILTICICIIS